jgi:hypothetical protein
LSDHGPERQGNVAAQGEAFGRLMQSRLVEAKIVIETRYIQSGNNQNGLPTAASSARDIPAPIRAGLSGRIQP